MRDINVEKLNDHEIQDLKRQIEKELSSREKGKKIPTYYVNSVIHSTEYFIRIENAMKRVTEFQTDIDEWLKEEPENIERVNRCAGVCIIKFAVSEMTEAHFNILKGRCYFDDERYE
ncbi:DUF5448 family protein [Xenorhabdus budapestensis]|uniref:DUF5448 family protein n=1 Tax=Xenorhabdus budapestensis TaxID=290110 RepID=A0ABX7VGQ2_XENBU|nr:DUF5448 family protein [Xenorhabdus budapestensis]QTL38782.1 DUF5448 family protein [Xenorhabdus budapestensis]